MIVQTVILPNEICGMEEIYFRRTGIVSYSQDCIQMEIGAGLSTDTYMNSFDASAWYKYTDIAQWKVSAEVYGTGKLKLVKWDGKNRRVVSQTDFEQNEWNTLYVDFFHTEGSGLYYVEIMATSVVNVRNIAFEAVRNPVEEKDIKLGLIVCTYHRRDALFHNINMIRNSRFFNSSDHLFGKLQVCVVDNGSEHPQIDEDHIKLYHNPNTGGSGGFTRGIVEFRKQQEKLGLSNVIFIDDDVEILAESLYRLYALLALLKDECKNAVVAGRMFRLDQRNVQYTAAEIWNRGDIQHIGLNCDMTLPENVLWMNECSNAEYGGWWFCSFPMAFVMTNIPLPFFLHCDDVEYGLRYGRTPIIMNGIQVWHETYEYRQSPVMAYYDMRNSLIVNQLYGCFPDKEQMLMYWKKRIGWPHAQKDYLTERMMILGIMDFCRGERWFRRHNSERHHQKLLKREQRLRKGHLRWGNAVLWRLAACQCRVKLPYR